MWKCAVCGAKVDDDGWVSCWKCSSGKDLSVDEVRDLRERITKTMSCLRCDGQMEYGGTKRFHEGSRLGILGDVAELFVSRETYDVYFCSSCGKVEFFVDGIGDAGRGESEGSR